MPYYKRGMLDMLWEPLGKQVKNGENKSDQHVESRENGLLDAIKSWAIENSIIATPTGSKKSLLLQIHYGISRL